MTHTVCQPCYDCKYTDCVAVCPVECFYQDDMMLYIDPNDCIDCEACVPECPVEAIFHDTSVPSQWVQFIQINADRVSVLKPLGGSITERQEPKVGPACRGSRREAP
jgi:ferredoxin